MSSATRLEVVRERVDDAVAADLTRSDLDRERRLVTEAILLVSRGGSRRVTVAGLRHADQVADASRHLAATSGVRLVRLSDDDGPCTDVAVEALDVAQPAPAATVPYFRPVATPSR